MAITRREFVRASAAAGALLAAPAVITAAKAGDRYRTALVGSGWWGMNIYREALASGQCQAVALCDVDDNQLEPALAEVGKLTSDQPRRYKDFRLLLEREKPEIVVVATPDHWHPLITIAAVKAGAHVYVEKPIGHTVNEGRAMVKAARASDRVVQVGTHRRVSPHNVSGMKFLKEGKAGKIGMVRAFVHYPGGPGAPTPDSEPPTGLDWDMWCGPAPLHAYNAKLHPKGFRLFLDYANGTIADWGVHWMDQILLWWTEEKCPERSPRPAAGSSSTTTPQPPTPRWPASRSSRSRPPGSTASTRATQPKSTILVVTSTAPRGRSTWAGRRAGPSTRRPTSKKAPIHQDPELHKPDDQNIRELFANFLRCIKTGERPVCDIEIGHRSTSMSLLAMLSLKLGRSIAWDGEKQVIVGDDAANQLLRREYRTPWIYPEI